MDRAYLKSEAKDMIRGNRLVFWGGILLVGVVNYLIQLVTGLVVKNIPAGIVATVISLVISIVTFIVSAGLNAGTISLAKGIAEGESVSATDVFSLLGMAPKFAGLMFVQSLIIMLWSILLIVPGIMKAFSYSQAFYIMIDNPDIGIMDALRESKEMMYGYRMQMFVLGLSFIGWILLIVVTLGIASIWVAPYMAVTYAVFYIHLRDDE